MILEVVCTIFASHVVILLINKRLLPFVSPAAKTPLSFFRDVPDIRPEPDSTGYQMNYPTGTRYLDTCCIIANFWVYFVVRIKCIIPCVCFQLCVLTHTA